MGFRKRVMTPVEKSSADSAPGEQLVMGSSRIFKGDQLQFIPMPTPDPKDPLNLPKWRKWLAIAALCFFGSLALSIESVIGHLIPVFFLEYNGIDPKKISALDSLPKEHLQNASAESSNPLEALSALENGTPLSQVVLLSTLPIFINGIASFFLIPLSAAVGRRPVMLLAGLLAWVGGIWAGQSTSLRSHLVARCFQGFGAGVVDALIPLILQDVIFVHQRNKAMATLNASQGVILICLSISSPYIALRLSWRHLYTIFSCLTALSWVSIIFCVPETRVNRSKEELAGKHIYSLHPDEARPRLDFEAYGARTKQTDFGVLKPPMLWKLGFRSLLDTFRCLVFPTVIWIILLTSIMGGVGGAMGQTSAIVLLTAGWKFEHLGLAGLSIIVATPFTWVFSGYLADKVSNHVSKCRGGHREPETNLINIVIPIILAVIGTCVFGYAAANIAHLSSAVLLSGVFLFVYGVICVNTTFQVFLMESYPNLAGPVLVTTSSFRLGFGFLLTFKATDWIKAIGFINMFGLYAGLIIFASLLGILVWVYGKRLRAFATGIVQPGPEVVGADKTGVLRKEMQSADSQPSNSNDNVSGKGGSVEHTRAAAVA